MFFFLSKTLNYLTMPLTLIFMMLVASALLRNAKWKKRLFSIGLVLLFIFSNDFIANEVMRLWEVKTIPYASMSPFEMGIVLTGATIPFLEPNDRVYFTRGADRVTHSVQLYKLGLIKKILISGGSGRLGAQPHRLFQGDFVERIHRHLDVGSLDARAVSLDAHLDVVIDDALDADQDFHWG